MRVFLKTHVRLFSRLMLVASLFLLSACPSTPPVCEKEVTYNKKDISPEYPREALESGMEGRVVVQFKVLGNGELTQFFVERSSGYEELDNAAVEAIKRTRFEPARSGCKPVSSWARVPITFKLVD